MTSGEDNIQDICKRVKQLLKDLFAAHVELTIEAKKWKKKYLKLKDKSCDVSKQSPSIFNALEHSSDSSVLFKSPLKNVVQQEQNNSLITSNVAVEVTQLNQNFVKRGSTAKNNIGHVNKSHIVQESRKLINSMEGSPCNLKAQQLKEKNYLYKKSGMDNNSILEPVDLPSDSERDFQSPEPFIPSWKRRELSRPSLIIPDTELMDCEEYDRVFSTPKKIHGQDTIKLELKIPSCGISTSKTKPYSLNAAKNLREFISPSPEKKKSLRQKASKPESKNLKSQRDEKKHLEGFFSIFDCDECNIKENTDNENSDKIVTNELLDNAHEVSRTGVKNDSFDKPVDDQLFLLETSAFDPDETYCPIMREKELLCKQKNSIRLSQYCTIDLDQTRDPVGQDESQNKSICYIETPPPPLNSQDYDQESQELIVCDPYSIGMVLNSPSECQSELAGRRRLNECDIFKQENNNILNKSASYDEFKRVMSGDSFNKVPLKKLNEPEYAHVDVIRKKNDRNKLEAFACEQCKKWYDAAGLTDEERKERMKSCRHRAKFQPTSTPEHYWSIGFPDTEVCKQRGYIEVEDENKPAINRARRKRAYRKIF